VNPEDERNLEITHNRIWGEKEEKISIETKRGLHLKTGG